MLHHASESITAHEASQCAHGEIKLEGTLQHRIIKYKIGIDSQQIQNNRRILNKIPCDKKVPRSIERVQFYRTSDSSNLDIVYAKSAVNVFGGPDIYSLLLKWFNHNVEIGGAL